MRRTLKKLVALVLTLTMLTGMLSISAFAAAPADQIVGQGGETTGENVVINKEIAATGVENVFDIVLDVTTTEDLSGNTVETAPDAAVALVVDVSRTMAFKYINGSSCQEKDTNSRLNVAKRVMLNFLADYAASGKNENGQQLAHRWVALIGFGGQAWNYVYAYNDGATSWVDVATDEGMAIMQSILRPVAANEVGKKTVGAVLGSGNKYLDWSGKVPGDNIDWTNAHGNGGTNIEAGLMLANNIWAAGGDVADVESKYAWTIMLSDGEPTMYVDPSNKVTKNADGGKGIESTSFIYGLSASSSGAINKTDYVDVPAEAEDLRDRTTFEIVAMGNDKWMNSKQKWDLVNNTTCGAWLATLSTSKTINTPGSTEADLAAAFSSISGSISRELSFMSADAWKVTDPMGENIEFLGFYDKDGGFASAQTLAGQFIEDAEDTAIFADNAIAWDLKSSGYAKSGDSTSFSIKYRVRLKTEAEGFVFGKAYAANGAANLQYQIVTSKGYSALKTLAFAVPSVKGLAAELSFLKTDAKGDALTGAVFTLAHAADCTCGLTLATTGTYTVIGSAHSFTSIPSGHSYTLMESTTPEGYVNEEGNRSFSVSFGELSAVTPAFSVDGEGNLTIQNISKQDILEGEKTSELVERKENRWEITVTVPGTGEEVTSHDEVIIMVDGSCSGDSVWPQTRAAIVELGKGILNGTGKTQLTLMTFGMSDNIVIQGIKSVEELQTQLTSLPGGLLYGRSSANSESGFTGIAEYITAHDQELDNVRVIYISDGAIDTDETPFTYGDFDTYTWLPNNMGDISALLKASLEYAISNGADAQATVEVFGGNEAAKEALAAYTTASNALANSETTMTEDALAANTAIVSEFEAKTAQWAAKVFEYAYAPAGLTVGAALPISVVEDAFVDYDKANGTWIREVFYSTAYGRSYPDAAARTTAAATALAAMPEVEHLYMVDNNAASSWMNPEAETENKVQGDNVSFTYDANVTNLAAKLKDILNELEETPVNSVYVTDYMSKWVNLIPDSFKIVDNSTGEVIWTIADGWAEDAEPTTAQEPPVKVELVDPANYADGGADVVGNTSGDIYKVTWYIKDGNLLLSDNYSLVYEVTADTEEAGFQYKVDYPSNGSTDVHYKDSTGEEQSRPIEVPDINGVEIKVHVGSYYEVGTDGTPNGTTSTTELPKSIENGMVTMNKTIAQKTDGENPFEVTLEVTTKQAISTIQRAPDTAVVLVVDTTESMFWGIDNSAYCSKCKKWIDKPYDHDYGHFSYMKAATKAEERFSILEESLHAFLDDYVEDAEGAERWVSVVFFGHKAQTAMGWLDVADTSQDDLRMRTIKYTVSYDYMTSKNHLYRWTAHSKGLEQAAELLADPTIADVDNKYVIMLTDGQPTKIGDYSAEDAVYDVGGDGLDNASSSNINKTQCTADCSPTCQKHYGNDNDGEVASGVAAAFKASHPDTPLYVVGFGTSGLKLYDESTKYNGKNIKVDANLWLQDWIATSPAHFSAVTSSTNVDLGLSKITETIKAEADVWTVTDPMGQYIDFVALKTANPNVTYNAATETLVWNLLTEETPAPNADGSYTYSLTYEVTLDYMADGFVFWDAAKAPAQWEYESNGATALEYIIEEVNGGYTGTVTTDYFNLPSVYAKIYE